MKHKKQKKTKKAGRILLAVFAVVIGTLGVLPFTSERWMRKTWPNLSMEELVYQLKAPIAGTSHDLLMSYVCSSALIADLNRVKFSLNPYNINRLTLKAGQAALEDTAYFEKTRAAIMDTRAWTMQQLTDRCFTVLDSRANFVFASTERINGGKLYKELKKNGILVRHFDAPRIENWLRITIGTPEQMQALMDAVDKILEV